MPTSQDQSLSPSSFLLPSITTSFPAYKPSQKPINRPKLGRPINRLYDIFGPHAQQQSAGTADPSSSSTGSSSYQLRTSSKMDRARRDTLLSDVESAHLNSSGSMSRPYTALSACSGGVRPVTSPTTSSSSHARPTFPSSPTHRPATAIDLNEVIDTLGGGGGTSASTRHELSFKSLVQELFPAAAPAPLSVGREGGRGGKRKNRIPSILVCQYGYMCYVHCAYHVCVCMFANIFIPDRSLSFFHICSRNRKT
jgi:hypothetical protein